MPWLLSHPATAKHDLPKMLEVQEVQYVLQYQHLYVMMGTGSCHLICRPPHPDVRMGAWGASFQGNTFLWEGRP